MTRIRDLIELYLSEKEAEEFAEWAFGEDFRRFDINYKAHIRWNLRHRELILKESGSPQDDIPKMIELWKKSEGIR
jgi:hypothetical protein